MSRRNRVFKEVYQFADPARHAPDDPNTMLMVLIAADNETDAKNFGAKKGFIFQAHVYTEPCDNGASDTEECFQIGIDYVLSQPGNRVASKIDWEIAQAEERRATPSSTVYIFVHGGVVQDVRSDVPIKVTVVDTDDLEGLSVEDYERKCLDGETADEVIARTDSAMWERP